MRRHPASVCDQRDLGEDLGAAVAAAHHKHTLSGEGLGSGVAGRVELLAAKVLLTWIGGNMGCAPRTSGADNGPGLPGAVRRIDDKTITFGVDL